MAALGMQDLVDARRLCGDRTQVVWTKQQINAALVAVDAWFDLPATRAAIGAAIEAAAPGVFSAPQKVVLVAAYLRGKFNAGA